MGIFAPGREQRDDFIDIEDYIYYLEQLAIRQAKRLVKYREQLHELGVKNA